MENMEMPSTQMTNNVPMPVSGGSIDLSSSVFDHETSSVESAFSTEEATEIQEMEEKDLSIPDRLLDSAKEEGFEKALQKLADGDFKNPELSDSDIKDSNTEYEGEVIDDSEIKETENLQNDELLPLHEQIRLLEEKVEVLQEENKQLLERAKAAEEANQANKEIMLALAKALYELAKKEENEEDKVSILELLVGMLTRFMQEAMTDYDQEENEKKQKVSKKTRKDDKDSQSVERLIQILKNNNQTKTLQMPGLSSKHYVEKTAA